MLRKLIWDALESLKIGHKKKTVIKLGTGENCARLGRKPTNTLKQGPQKADLQLLSGTCTHRRGRGRLQSGGGLEPVGGLTGKVKCLSFVWVLVICHSLTSRPMASWLKIKNISYHFLVSDSSASHGGSLGSGTSGRSKIASPSQQVGAGCQLGAQQGLDSLGSPSHDPFTQPLLLVRLGFDSHGRFGMVGLLTRWPGPSGVQRCRS